MKSAFRLARKKAKVHIPQFLGLMLLLIVGVCFYITLSTIVLRYEETAEQYFIDNAYADVTFSGAFDDDSVSLLGGSEGIISAQGRTVRDYREGERIFRVISLTDGVNVPYLYDGRFPSDETECIILKRNADSMGFSVGDKLNLGERTLKITGLTASPEYIYMVQNERTMMAQAERFGVVFVYNGFFPAGYNEIVALASGGFSPGELSEKIGAFRYVLQKDEQNHTLYRSDLGEIGSFAAIFPFIFAVLIAVVIYVMLSRTIQKDRKQIGTMKSLGVTDGRIIGIYLSQFGFAALAGAFVGCVAAVFICDFIIGIFSSMFEVPTLSFAFYPVLWTGAIFVSILLCVISGLIALVPILKLMPAHAMRPRVPKGGRRIFLERVAFLWRRLSFNTRYALKNSFRNKSRFFAVVLGMCGSCALLTFSLGFCDSIGNTQGKYFNDFADYDVIVNFDPIPLSLTHIAFQRLDESQKALMLHADIAGEQYPLVILENGFDMLDIPAAALSDGVIIPEYFSEMWNAGVGDALIINEYEAVISAVAPQYLGLTLFTGYDYINQITNEIPAVYNTIYGKSGDMAELETFLKGNGIDFTTIDDDKTSFDSIMESMSVLIWFMIACSVVLGFTVLYSVGLINLSAREYEYMFMGVMGYPPGSILAAHIKETAGQLVMAIPLGFVLGNVILEGIKGEFSGSNFVISTAVLPQSYVISMLSVICVTAIMVFVTSRHIDRLDIVEGLKVQDE